MIQLIFSFLFLHFVPLGENNIYTYTRFNWFKQGSRNRPMKTAIVGEHNPRDGCLGEESFNNVREDGQTEPQCPVYLN